MTSSTVPGNPESVFTYGAPQLKFGNGASDEIGFDLSRYGVRRVLVVTDPGVAATGHPQRVADQMAQFGIEARVFDGVHVEPTDVSLVEAIDEARSSGPWDAFVAVGGGSSIDTAKAINLLTTNPGELMDYVNVPVGKGQAPSQPLKPLVAVPTTTGTGSESTTICVMDVIAQRVKTGISHAWLRPTLAVIDPDLTLSQPPGVTAASGMDILCHALESYTARWYTTYDRKSPDQRVPYCGSNPISDMWSEKAMSLLAGSFRTAVRNGEDAQARSDMAIAATFAGMGFGNAGVHIPHANAYPIAGQVKDFHPKDYPAGEPMVPHGMSVALTAPEAFRFTFEASPERHVRAAELLAPGADRPSDAAEFLPTVLADLMRDIDIPNGVGAVGFGEGDIPELVDGAMKQQRLLATCPRAVTEDDLAGIFRRSISLW
ncbi:iron-containing alcohol dehydrogenase [Blastococcus sp. MG754426]|uniref:hydroxyacid-oxoacid transhydrogenase n=1 Tax=unclassified Blastococcus TaxID=2619396 RepID=UPI001EF12834|nr:MULTISPECIES: hydroxyacid-oxoacid transhydrogenase [unclassified Blastococcus]MCF6507015.1 iron-containing alcohol dehydrogenase [Blastococcus sp. MG754426]MCF6511680.1 iron-containing alcohol dehydrogenase [Blastococcus sp. MG754427]